MSDITKLPDSWRNSKFPAKCPVGGYGFSSGKRHCAEELEAALPKWEIFTADKSTHPKRGTRIFCAVPDDDGDWFESFREVWDSESEGYIDEYYGIAWREVIPALDFPPSPA